MFLLLTGCGFLAVEATVQRDSESTGNSEMAARLAALAGFCQVNSTRGTMSG